MSFPYDGGGHFLRTAHVPDRPVVLKYEMGNFWRNGQYLGERGQNGQFLGEMGMINRVMA